MEQRRITMTDLVIGKPLPWDVTDSAGHLLLSRGHIVERAQQIESLIARGMYVEAKLLERDGPPVHAASKVQELPSVLRLINLSTKRLERLLFNIDGEEGVQEKFLEVAKTLARAVAQNPDIALGCILLNQQNGSYVVRHAVDTALLALSVARTMKKEPDEVLSITAAALTMNVGMLRLQDQLQTKAQPLSESERETVRNHPGEGVKILERNGVTDANWLACVLLHHENEDGSGYPEGRAGAAIPENAKIISIADRYCARVSGRAYRKSLLPNGALREIMLSDNKTIDAALAALFIRVLGIYPPGTFVRLANGEVGVVTGHGTAPTAPTVHALIGPRGAPLAFPIKRETAKQLYAVREVIGCGQADVRFSMQQLWGSEATA